MAEVHVAATPMADAATIHAQMRGVTRIYPGPGGKPGVQALAATDLTLRRGEFYSVIGPSGCGKSTLLDVLAGLSRPTAGSITFEGKPVDGVPDGVGVVFQEDASFSWLTVADNIRRALETVTEDARAGEGPLKTLIEGIELTERDLLKTLERHGVRKLDPAGQKFDPNLHQAMFEVEDPNKPNGTVVQVVQAGFVIGDRVLRPALVGVSKGGPKPATTNGSAEQAAGE